VEGASRRRAEFGEAGNGPSSRPIRLRFLTANGFLKEKSRSRFGRSGPP